MPEPTTSDAAPSLWRRLWYTRLWDALRFRFDASLDWRRVLAAAELPDELKQVVYDTVRATRLWNREKVDVTRELVDHFLDGLDRGRPAPILVATFGDPKQTAALIRRAKKRGRSLGWHVARYGLNSFLILLVVYVLFGLYLAMGRPTIKTDFLAVINERAAAVPEHDRAWPLYRSALLELGGKGSEGKSDLAELLEGDARPGDKDWPAVEKFLNVHASAVGQLREAAGHEGLGFIASTSHAAFTPEDRQLFGVTVSEAELQAHAAETLEDRWLFSTLLPHVQEMRTAGRVLLADARRAAEAGDSEVALADVTATLGVSRHAFETPFLVSLMVSVAIQRATLDTVEELLSKYPELWTNEQLRDLAHVVAAAKVDWRRGLEGERASFADVMQRMYTDDGDGGGWLVLQSGTQNTFQLLGTAVTSKPTPLTNRGIAALVLPAANLVMASRKEMTAEFMNFMDAVVRSMETPLWELERLEFEEGPLSKNAGMLDRVRYLLVDLLAPAYHAVRSGVATVEGEREGVLVGIALELYHREHGTWPKSLEELSPRWLPAVPVDRITGEPLRYKVVADRPMVYSVGADKDDDQGQVPSDEFGRRSASLASPSLGFDGDWVVWGAEK